MERPKNTFWEVFKALNISVSELSPLPNKEDGHGVNTELLMEEEILEIPELDPFDY